MIDLSAIVIIYVNSDFTSSEWKLEFINPIPPNNNNNFIYPQVIEKLIKTP